MSCRAAVGSHHQIPIRILGKTASERARARERETETERDTETDRQTCDRGVEERKREINQLG